MPIRFERDSGAQYVAAFFFSISLGIVGVAYPLFVLDQGQSATTAGLASANPTAVPRNGAEQGVATTTASSPC